MSEHTDKVRNSAAVANLRECVELLRSLPIEGWDDEEARQLITRLTAAANDILGRLTIGDRNLIPGNVIDELEDQTHNILEAVQSLSDSAPSVEIDISDANDQIDQILVTASSLPVLRIRTTNAVLEKAAEQFDREANSARAAISKDVDSLRTELADFYQGIQNATTDFNNRLAEIRELVDQRASEAQDTFGSLSATINEATERLQREVTSIQETFRESQGRQFDEFTESQSQRFAEFTAAQETRDQEFHERLDSTIEDIESYRDQARNMLEEVAGASSAEHYAKQRDAQKSSADSWRLGGVIAFLALCVAAVGIFIDARLSEEDFSLVWFAARTGVLGTLAAFTTIAMRQSGQHRRREEQIDRVANELMLLWPFVNRLPDEDRLAVILHVAPLYFKGGLPMGVEADSGIGVERIRNAITQAMQRRSNRNQGSS